MTGTGAVIQLLKYDRGGLEKVGSMRPAGCFHRLVQGVTSRDYPRNLHVADESDDFGIDFLKSARV
eukprot:1320589-Pleurochrysis_carterae.AAC.2